MFCLSFVLLIIECETCCKVKQCVCNNAAYLQIVADFLGVFMSYAMALHSRKLHLPQKSYNKQVMAKKKNQNRKEKFEKKSAIESLKFLTHYGLRQMAYEDGDMFHGLESGGIWEKLFSKRVANQDKSV